MTWRTWARSGLLWGMVLSLALPAQISLAQTPLSEEDQEARAVVLEAPLKPSEQDPATPSLTIKIDTEKLAGSPTDLEEKEAPSAELQALLTESQRMQSPEYLNELKKKVVMPLSSPNPADIEAMASMSVAQQERFFKIRNRTLAPLVKFFRLAFFKPAASNRILREIDARLFQNANVLGSSKREIIILGLGGALGASLSKTLNQKLQSFDRFKNFPENAGIFWALSLGLMIVRTTKDGVAKLSFEPVMEFRRAQETTTPFLFGAINLVAGRIWELEKNGPGIKKSEFAKASFLTVSKSRDSLGLLLTPGAAFPPMMGYITSAAKGDNHQVQFNRAGIKGFLETAQAFLKERRTRAPYCRRVLATQ